MWVWSTIIKKLDRKWSYLTMFACPFGQYWYKWLPFGAVLVDDMFQWKIDEIFSDMHNVFGIADGILVIGYDDSGADHDATVHKVLWQCKEVNLKLNKEKCHFRCISILFFEKVTSREGLNQIHKESNPDGHASAKQQKGTAGFLIYY